MPMRALSLFSGAGGLDLGLERAGVSIVGQCELGWTVQKREGEPDAIVNTFTREHLRRHWPDTPLHDDVTTLNPEEFRGRVDLVAGGSPCQDLSVAGRRGGLDGARSGLFWQQCRIADQVDAPWVLWENVAGALSSNDGADFASVLWGLTGALPRVPDGGWRTAGVVVGPKRTAVWRLLDARWFGVAQRRRRVFVVAGPRGQCGPEVLLEPEGVRGDPEPSRAAGTAVAALTARGVGTCGADDNQAQAGHLIPALANTLTARDAKVAPTYIDAGAGNLIPIAFGWSNAAAQGDDVVVDGVASLRTKMQPAVAYPIDMRNAMRSSGTGAGTQGDGLGDDGDPMYTLTGSTMGRPAVATEMAVRRLTPRECERLMGWPDDFTRWTDTGKQIADSHRYRMCGNGVVAPVAEWIGRRIEVTA